MIEFLRVVDVDQKFARAVAFGKRGEFTFIALVIRRVNARKEPYWCYYLGLTLSQYKVIAANQDEYQLSFLSIPSDHIGVTKLTCDRLSMDVPQFWCGIHLHDSAVIDKSSEGIVVPMHEFCDSVLSKLESHEHGD